MSKFKLSTNYTPAGDQPKAIEALIKGVRRGDRHQTLLGVTGSGKSVTGDTPVLIRHNGEIKNVPIHSVVDALLTSGQGNVQHVHDTEVLNSIEGYEAYSFNPVSMTSSWKKITQVTRHASSKILFQIKTTCGRSVTVTRDHNFYVLRKGQLELVRTDEAQEGDFVPVPREIPGYKEPLVSIVTEKYLTPSRYFVAAPTLAQHSDIILFSGYVSRQKMWRIINHGERLPLETYQTIVKIMPTLAENARIGSRARRYDLPTELPLTPEFLRFIGYYIAEGHAEKSYITISSGDSEIVTDFTEATMAFGIEPKHRLDTYDYQISSRAFTEILKTMCGGISSKKRLPGFWTKLSTDQLAELFKAYFSADGGVEENAVSCTTVSKQLASDINYALLRFGIVARTRRRLVRIPNTDRRSECWTISITGQPFLRKFQQEIGFVLERKNQRLQSILSKEENTNVDIIPIDGGLLRSAREAIGLFQRDIADVCNVERSYISMLENGERHPSRSVCRQVIDTLLLHALQKKDSKIEASLRTQQALLELYWSPIKTIEKVSGEKYVYDFAVEDNETFLAGYGGLFVHNTFTAANVIAAVQKPTLVIAHNKTLAAQLAQEYADFFPENDVHYFVSYYDYYQPEAYMPISDTYIEKEAMINEEIDRLRHASTQALLSRRDVIIVASVSCIYGLGSPIEYEKVHKHIIAGTTMTRHDMIRALISLYFERTNADLAPGHFRALGNTVEIMPTNERVIYRLLFSGDTITKIERIDAITRAIMGEVPTFFLFPAKHFVTPELERKRAITDIELELKAQLAKFEKEGLLLEAERIKRRTQHDLALIREIGYCNGIENYSRHFDGRAEGEAPYTLLSYFPHKADGSPDFLTIIDESHVTIPQLGAMYAGDRSRKDTLVEHGFRLPSACDNRPLMFDEFEGRVGSVIYTSATPGVYELAHSTQTVEQIIRPTGLVDPEIVVRPIVSNKKYPGQVRDFIAETEQVVRGGGRVLTTTLTKKMAEDLSEFLKEQGVKAEYIHSEIKTLDRITILTEFRKGTFDCLVGVNLLREGLDLPEVELVAVLDADKEGFLRSETSLIQTIGRAARNVNGRVILYADEMTGSLEKAIGETNRRRVLQLAYNKEHGITPQTIKKEIKDITQQLRTRHDETVGTLLSIDRDLYKKNPKKVIKEKSRQMTEAVKLLDFETSAILRDEIRALEESSHPYKK